MPKQESVRKRGSALQWSDLLQRYESSGLTQEKFCLRHGLALSSFQRWRRRLRARRATADFVEIVSASNAAPPPATWSLEVSLPGGVSLRFGG